MRRSLASRLSLIGASALLLAACSTGADTASSTTTTRAGSHPAATTRGITSTSITVEGLAPLSSARAATLPGSDIGARAVFNKVNASGGVYGRKINLLGVKDDGDDPGKNLDAARQIVLGDQAFAVVPVITPDMGSASFLEEQHVPTVGELYDTLACQKSYLFGVNGCTSPPPAERVYSPGPGYVLRDGLYRGNAASRTVAITMDDDPIGHASIQACAGPFRTAGFKVVLDSLFLPTTAPITDYTPYVQQLMTANNGKPPDIVWTCNVFSTAVGVIGALKAAGFQGVIYNPVTYDPRLLEVPPLADALNGTYVYTLYAPAESAQPPLPQVKADIAAVDPSAQLSIQVLAGYYSAELFVDILRKAGKHLTAESFAAAGNNNFTFNAKGAVCPVTFPLAHDQGMVGGGLVRVVDGKYQVVSNLTCLDMSSNVHY